MQDREVYQGFEQGPIRPPSESGSLLIRVTRNCPWNRCTFCGLYKGEVFSRRPVDHVCRDIDTVAHCVEQLRAQGSDSGATTAAGSLDDSDHMAWYAARNWLRAGARSVFLQDSNSLIIKPDDMVAILEHLRATFPSIERITSYARSQTVARITDTDLARIAAAGLNRIHIGMESGANAVLDQVRKGTDQQAQINAGRQVVAAGIELSEYYMPGLGGRRLSREHALASAEALNQINPHFIRLRTLAIPPTIDLAAEVASGAFEKLGDRETAEELLLFLENLSGITSHVKSDHILNLFEEVDGVLPRDKERMVSVVQTFLDLPAVEQVLYQVGRRAGLFRRLDDRHDPTLRSRAQEFVDHWQVTPANVDLVVDQLMQRFI